MKLFVATKAFIRYDGKVLILRESTDYEEGTNAGRFDVPGGRINPGERFDDSLLREIAEETGLSVTLGRPFFMSEWRPEVDGERWQIIGTYFTANADSDAVSLGDDHDSYEWIDPASADSVPLIDDLKDAFRAYLGLEES